MNSRVVCLAALLLSVGAVAGAWSSAGHQFITGAAVSDLPTPLNTFFQNNLSTIKTNAGTEPPFTHYIDIDYFPDFFAGTFPRDYNVACARYGKSTVDAQGTGPWTAATYLQTLTTSMANARTSTNWTNLLSTAGALAHYLEDLHNPMHLAENYDGQLTGQDGIHSRYESTMISKQLSAGTLNLNVAPSHCVLLSSPIDTIFNQIDTNYYYNDDILSADLSAKAAAGGSYNNTYYSRLWSSTGSFTTSLMQEGAETVASAWYTAWVNAGMPKPAGVTGLAGDANWDNRVSFSDYLLLEQNFGRSSGGTWGRGDFNNDGKVTFSDYLLVEQNFGKTVPEPAVLLLLLGGLALRRR